MIDRPRSRATRVARWCVGLATCGLALAIAFVAVRYHHADNRVVRWWHGWAPADAIWAKARWHGRSLQLPDYRFVIENRAIDGIDGNLSGLDFDRDRNELLAAINRPAEVVVLDREGRLLRRHRLQGASDVEALAYLGDGMVALLQEGRQSIAIARLPARDGEPMRVVDADAYALAIGGARNDGPEGMAYDPSTDTLYVTKERDPTGLYAIRGLRRGGGRVVRTDHSDWLRAMPFATDLSSIEFDRAHRHLLLLSDESQMLIEITDRGEPVGWLKLDASTFAGLPAPQAEGVTLDDAGNLYLVSEPNLFYRMRRPGH